MRLSFCTVGLGMGQKFQLVQSFVLQKCDLACLGFCTAPSHETNAPAFCFDFSGRGQRFLVVMLLLYVGLVKLAVWTFVTTYLLSAKTIIYFLLRKEIDNTAVTDVYVEEEGEETKEIPAKETDKPSSPTGDDKEGRSYTDED